THYYFAQAVYILGDDGWEKLYGDTPPAERLMWSKYREGMFDQWQRMQNADGSWPSGGGFSVGPGYSTAIYGTLMQLDKGTLPIYQRYLWPPSPPGGRGEKTVEFPACMNIKPDDPARPTPWPVAASVFFLPPTRRDPA